MKELTFKEMKKIEKEPMTAEKLHSIIRKRFYSPSEKSKLVILSTILENINIQAALAHQFFYQRDFGTTLSQPEEVFLTSSNFDEEGSKLALIFDKVFLSFWKDGRPMSVQVSDPDPMAFQAFSELLTDNRINSVVRHIYVKEKFKHDFRQKAYFEIESSDLEITSNNYFDYLLKSSLESSYVNPPSIDVSSFSIDEIEQDELIQQLAAQVKNLYLIIHDLGDPDFPVFCKKLMWYL